MSTDMHEWDGMQETALEDIDKAYDKLQHRFRSRATYPIEWRLYNLKQLGWLIKDNEAAMQAACKKDLDTGPLAASITDLWPVLNEIALAIKRVHHWMDAETRWSDSMLAFKFMRPRIHKQPRGVSLIISPWNYPWQLSFVPLVNAIAAGCPVILKPSEYSPACSALMAKLIPLYLDAGAYAVVLGGPKQATHLLEKPWGHIVYTGSARVGKMVAAAAAQTLSPTTLELGGKSPVLVSKCADMDKITRRMFSIKQLTCGQMCVTPDYILCDRDVVDQFIDSCTKALNEFYPPHPDDRSMLNQPFTSRLRTKEGYDRQLIMMDQADSKSRLVYRGETDEGRLRMGFSLVLLQEGAVGESGPLVAEEIFGPVLPIIPYSSLDAAIQYINNGPDPLALYVCSTKKAIWKRVVNETRSGSACWNDFAFPTFARALPFGGIGASGYGSYHGYDGFKTFSHFKTTLQVPLYLEPLMKLRYPPITSFGQKILTSLLLTGTTYNRPKSVLAEKTRWRWRRRYLIVICITLYLAWLVVLDLNDIVPDILQPSNC